VVGVMDSVIMRECHEVWELERDDTTPNGGEHILANLRDRI